MNIINLNYPQRLPGPCTGNKCKIIEIKQWGDSFRMSNTGSQFQGCENLYLTNLTDILSFQGVTNASNMFDNVPSITFNNANSWDVSNVTNMADMFRSSGINTPIGNWNVSRVVDMSFMFFNANNFNQPIGNWNVSNVTNMNTMLGCLSFNQPISGWNVSNVTNMVDMFWGGVFNQPISNWERTTPNVSTLSNVKNMMGMFRFSKFNQNIGNWNVSGVTNMSSMFQGAVFNKPINTWNVSNVSGMTFMFSTNIYFNQPLNSWNVIKVRDMSYIFAGATTFNQPVNNWVSRFDSLNKSPNTPDNGLFEWMNNKTNLNYSTQNYDLFLIAWASLTNIPSGFVLKMGESGFFPNNTGVCYIKYSAAGANARNILTGAPNYFSICDGGL